MPSSVRLRLTASPEIGGSLLADALLKLNSFPVLMRIYFELINSMIVHEAFLM